MPKYISRRFRSEDDDEWFEDEYFNPLHIPLVDDAAIQPTGLVDSDGVPLWRVPNPIGFGRKFEW